jgi:hypothetical protein
MKPPAVASNRGQSGEDSRWESPSVSVQDYDSDEGQPEGNPHISGTEVQQIANTMSGTPDNVDSKLFCLSQVLSTSGFSDFLESNQGMFILHYIQRPYEWNDEMAVEFVKSLVSDWKKSTLQNAHRPTPKHIGQIILWTEGQNQLWVMDGQQRLVTIYILLSLLHYSLLSTCDRDAADSLWNEAKDLFGLVEKEYNPTSKAVITTWMPRMRVGEFQRQFWEEHIVSPARSQTPSGEGIQKYLQSVHVLLNCKEHDDGWVSLVNGDPIIARMIKNMKAIHQYLSTSVDATPDGGGATLLSRPEAIQAFLRYLLKHVFLTTTTHVGGGHEFSCRTFLSANSMQAPLTGVDMLKAALFSNVEKAAVADCSKIWESAYLGLEKHTIRACSNITAFEFMFEVIREIKDMPSGKRAKLPGILHYFYGEYGHTIHSRQKFHLPGIGAPGVEKDPKAFLLKFVDVVSRNMTLLFNWRKIGDTFPDVARQVALSIDRLKTSCRNLLRCASIKPNRGAYNNRRPSLYSWIPVAVVFFELFFPKESHPSDVRKRNLKELATLMKLLEIRLAWVVIAAQTQGSDIINVMSSGGQWRGKKTDGILKIICHPCDSSQLKERISSMDENRMRRFEAHQAGTVPADICREQLKLVKDLLRLTHDEKEGMVRALLKVRYDKNDSTKMRHIMYIHDDEMRCPTRMEKEGDFGEGHSILKCDYNMERTKQGWPPELQLDHIFPQGVHSPDDYWDQRWSMDELTKEAHDILKHLPGNICWLPGLKNKKAGKQGYDKKIEVFNGDLQYVDIRSTRALIEDYTDWTPANCRSRDLQVLTNVVKYLKISPNDRNAREILQQESRNLCEDPKDKFWFKRKNQNVNYEMLNRWDPNASLVDDAGRPRRRRRTDE